MDPTTSSAKAAKVDSSTLKKLKERYPQRSAEQLEGYSQIIEAHESTQGEPVAWIVTGDSRLLVFRRPEQEEWEDAGERIRRGERNAIVYRELGMTTVLEPKVDDMPGVFKRWPGLYARISDALTRLVGAEEELVVKKD